MKKIHVILFALFLGYGAFAQQDHQYTLFMYNKLQLNPGYAGERGVGSLTGIYRNQWLGFEGAPTSGFLSFNTPFLSPRVGMGLTISAQEAGISKDYYGALAYSYDLINNDVVSLRFGLQGSLRSFSLDFNQDLQTSVNQGSDQSLLNSDISNSLFGNFGAGIYCNVQDKYWIGLSVPKIYSNVIGLNSALALPAREYRHVYAMAGASFPLGNDVALMPAILVKYVANQPQAKAQFPNLDDSFYRKYVTNAILDADINLSVDVRQKVTAGLSYRLGGDGNGESIDLTVMLQAAPKLGIGFAYDFGLSKLKDYHSGSIEAMIRYDIKTVDGAGLGKEMSNPRFFF